MRTNARRVVFIAFAVAWLFDFFFWDQSLGVNFTIFAGVLCVAGLATARLTAVRPAKSVWILLALALLSGLFAALRQEPLTVFLSIICTLLALVLSVQSLTEGRWYLYEFRDYLVAAFHFVIGSLSGQIAHFNSLPTEAKTTAASKRAAIAPVLRGLLFAIPIVFIFGSMLASADPIFANLATQVFSWFRLENFSELLFRAVYISIGAFLTAGILFFAVRGSREENIQLEGHGQPLTLIGLVEANIILSSVNLLFLVFVSVQFRYFFGGQENIHLNGYTFAEYARRGFGELIAVAFFSLLLLIVLTTFSRAQPGSQKTAFSVLAILLIGLLTIILVSSAQRLSLYETAYGFTRLRTYTHVFIVWLGILLLSVGFLLYRGRMRHFALVCLISVFGYSATIGLLNVDAFVAHQNISRFNQGQPLDISYLASLSTDALSELLDQRLVNPDAQPELDAAIVCHAANHQDYNNTHDWRSFNISRAKARILWEALQTTESLSVVLHQDVERYGWHYVELNNEIIWCQSAPNWD